LRDTWHPTKNDKTPNEISIHNASRRVWWKCSVGHEWDTSLTQRVALATGCPTCKHKTQQKLFDFLSAHYTNVVQQFKIDSCKLKNHLPFDFCIPGKNTIIELDGDQHFKQVSTWKPPDKKRDAYKMKKAKEAGYKVIRLYERDVFNYTYSWLEEYLLVEISSSDRSHTFISTIDTLYDEHIALCETNDEIAIDDAESTISHV
jgi:hypothetical protein